MINALVFQAADVHNAKLMREKVLNLEAQMRDMPQVELETSHYWADGMYARVLTIPAGTLIVGKVHKKSHFYIVAKGKVQVGLDIYEASSVIVSRPGAKRAIYALEDSIFMTIHRTKKRNLDRIEAQLIEPDNKALFTAENKLKLDVLKFRELTSRVIAAEKPGFWSDWTPEQQSLYTSGDWRGFSVSRGYSEEEIEDYSMWCEMIKNSLDAGLNPYSFINDLATAAALANMKIDSKGEIMKSSHLPFASREKELTCRG